MKKQSIAVIKQLLATNQLTNENIIQLRQDQRKGIQDLIKKYDKNKAHQEALLQKYHEMQQFENNAKNKGFSLIAGVDEAGRGPLAGPVVTAAVILPDHLILPGLNDSKKLTVADRNHFFDEIIQAAVSYDITIISNEEIDEVNILQATKRGMKSAINNLSVQPDYVLLDAVELSALACPSETIIKGDERSVSIAAASVLAKVTRDRIMKQIHEEYPMYDFAANMGYGTKAHLDGIKRYGITKYHRRTFAPIRNMVKE